MPVLVVEDVAVARPLAEALIAGGLSVLEVTLRTPAALDVIKEMANVPGATVGAGTLLSPKDAVSYTHLTLPTKREEYITAVADSLNIYIIFNINVK